MMGANLSVVAEADPTPPGDLANPDIIVGPGRKVVIAKLGQEPAIVANRLIEALAEISIDKERVWVRRLLRRGLRP